MIKLTAIFGLMTVLSTSAFADQRSDNFLATALIQKSIQAEVSEFGKLVKYVGDVTFDHPDSESDRVVLKGMVIRGGDIACGIATLTIQTGRAIGFGGQPVTTYRAEVDTSKVFESCR